MNISINDFEQIYRNLYKYDGKYYVLFGKGITPNNCWIIAPIMKEMKDIDVATGTVVYGESVIEFDVTGSVQAGREFIKY